MLSSLSVISIDQQSRLAGLVSMFGLGSPFTCPSLRSTQRKRGRCIHETDVGLFAGTRRG
jgi:hypothetical protein